MSLENDWLLSEKKEKGSERLRRAGLGGPRVVIGESIGLTDVQVQLKKDYYKSYAAETEPLWIKPREIEIWERMSSREWTKSKRENFM